MSAAEISQVSEVSAIQYALGRVGGGGGVVKKYQSSRVHSQICNIHSLGVYLNNFIDSVFLEDSPPQYPAQLMKGRSPGWTPIKLSFNVQGFPPLWCMTTAAVEQRNCAQSNA